MLNADSRPKQTNKQYVTMKAQTSNVSTSATSAANALWACVSSSHDLTLSIASLCQAAGENYKAAGEAFGLAWSEIGGGVSDSQATRHLVEACFATTMERKSASKFLNGVGLVSKQRIYQLLCVVYDGDKSKNNGNGKADEESQDGLDKSEGNGFTFEQILASLKLLPSITKEQAQILAATAASKIA
jgi:hypothetical protein